MPTETASSPRTSLAGWACRIAVFALAVTLTTIVLHRFTSLPTPHAINLLIVAGGLSVLAAIIAIAAYVVIWRRGMRGSGLATLGLLLALAQVAWPLPALPVYLELPWLADVSTDLDDPPRFTTKTGTGTTSGRSRHPSLSETAAAQRLAYPDLRAVTFDRTSEDVHQIVADTVRRLRWTVVSELSPEGSNPGLVEAYDRTLVLGFYDDIVIRVGGEDGAVRVDVRSASRYAAHDLGRNAERVRGFMGELKNRVAMTQPSDVAAAPKSPRRGTRNYAKNKDDRKIKRGGSDSASRAEDRKRQGRERRDSRRAPEPRERPR